MVPRSVMHYRVLPQAGVPSSAQQLTGFGTPKRNSNGRAPSIRAWRKFDVACSGQKSSVYFE
ncbi:hypothetical protein DID97_07435 [Burkholderia sp. Bp8977]|nr:hypothetical protein DIE02_07175 [Burkholderia sp. Bp8991]RQS79298.1 hypothetical protein DID97_07435 [Burkholderia sp. Bp8977]